MIASVRKDFAESVRSRIFVFRPLVEQEVGDLRAILIVVLSATALLLVLACVNVTNLLLRAARAARRKWPCVSRSARAAAALVRQLLTESIVLATAGAVARSRWSRMSACACCWRRAPRSCRASHTMSFDTNVLLFALGRSS